jgi:hypothetical protein
VGEHVRVGELWLLVLLPCSDHVLSYRHQGHMQACLLCGAPNLMCMPRYFYLDKYIKKLNKGQILPIIDRIADQLPGAQDGKWIS